MKKNENFFKNLRRNTVRWSIVFVLSVFAFLFVFYAAGYDVTDDSLWVQVLFALLSLTSLLSLAMTLFYSLKAVNLRFKAEKSQLKVS